jgi:tetratricopeptide (TPR) repeat protein
MGRRWIFGLLLALCFSTSVQAQGVPSGTEARFVSQDLKALSLYFEGMAILEEGQKGKPFKLFEKAKTRIEKRLNSGQLNSGDLAVLFNIARITGNSEEMLRLGRFRLFIGGEFVDEELISVCAQTAYSQGDLESAIVFLKAGDRFLPPSMERSVAVSNLYANMGEADSALANMARLFKYPEYEIDAGIRYSMLLNDFGLDNEAYIALELLMERFPDALGLQLARAKFLQGRERQEEANAAFEAIYRNPDFSEEAIAQDFGTILDELQGAELPLDHSAWQALLRLSALACEVRPESALLARVRGDVLVFHGDKREAIAVYEHSLTLENGPLWEVYENISVTRHELGDLEGYLATALAANEAFPDHERAPLLFGTALDMNGQPDQAIIIFQIGLKRSQSQHQGNSPLAPEYYFRLGTAFFHAGDLENMSTSLDRLLLFFPDHTQAKNNYAYYLANFGVRLDEALTMVDAALKDQPENANYWDTKAVVLMNQGKWGKASGAMAECLQFGGAQNAASCLHAAEIFYHLDRKEDMETYLTKAIENGASEEEVAIIRRQLLQSDLQESAR